MFLSVLAVYLLTAHYVSGHNSDTVVAVWPAYAFTHTGTFRLDHVQSLLPPMPGFIEVGPHIVAARSVGVLLAALPVQVLLGWTGVQPETLGAVTASLMTAAAVATIYCVLKGLAPRDLALAATAVLGFGTAFWTIAAAELWTHSPDVLWLSLGLLATSKGRLWSAGVPFALAVFTRPHLVLVVAAIGLSWAWRNRAAMPLLAFGVPGVIAVASAYLWNWWYYGVPSISGSYAGHVEGAFTGSVENIPSLGANLIGTTVSPWCGVLLFTPVVAAAIFALPRHTRSAPWWTRAAAAGAVLYLLAQFRVSNFDGGGLQFGNRYMTEPLMLFLPLMLCAYQCWAADSSMRRTATATLGAASVGIYAIGAFLTPYWRGIRGDWVAWYPYVVVRTAGVAGLVLAVAVSAAVALVFWLSWQAQRASSDDPGGLNARVRA